MSQIFSPAAVLGIKLALIAGAGVAVAAVGVARWRMAPAQGEDEPAAQPIPFSHKHHVGDDGIDCRYCHTTVDRERAAGMPSTAICFTCHSRLFAEAPMLAPLRRSLSSGRPVRWRRLHDLPDFVFFNHAVHVAKGVSCGECHGPVDQMPLTWRHARLEMQWCLACHRAPAAHLHPPGEVFSAARNVDADPVRQAALAQRYRLESTRRLTDCSTCHR